MRNIKLHKLNMQVSHIYASLSRTARQGGVTPAAVYLIGRMEDAYSIAMLVKEKGTTEND